MGENTKSGLRWEEWAQHILEEIKHHKVELKQFTESLHKLDKEVSVKIATLETKCSILGVFGGAVVSLITFLLKR